MDQNAVISSSVPTNSTRPVVDTTQPTTVIQIRLASGKRLRETLNLSHTVQDIQTIIHLYVMNTRDVRSVMLNSCYCCREGAGNAPYALLAGFPPQPLKDMNATIEQAQLKGAAITQKLV